MNKVKIHTTTTLNTLSTQLIPVARFVLVRISNEKRSKSTVSKPSTFSKLFKPLPSSSSSSEFSTTSEQLTQHRQLITLYLNQLLQSVSERQRVQQETRIQRQLEKTSSLGGFGGAAVGGGGMLREFGEKMAEKAEKDYKLGKRLSKGGGEGEEFG